MVKLIAALFMLIDHIGLVLFPDVLIFRIIGRLSMPIFAYCIARGFYYSKQRGSHKKYLLHMLVFALVSQLPYCLMIQGGGLNIGFTWLLSILLLFVSTMDWRSPVLRRDCMAASLSLVCIFVYLRWLPVDYGIYGVITPLLFYLAIAKNKETTINYVLVLILGWSVYAMVNKGDAGSMAQLISVASAPLITVSKKYDGKVVLPKLAYYAFYPLHITILVVLRYLV